jgi:hypothetical protein
MTIRDDKLTFDPDCYCGEGVPVDEKGMCTGPKALQNKLGDWNEWYVDIHSKKCKKHIRKVMQKRIKAAAKKGCDGVDPDNVDEVCRFHFLVIEHANINSTRILKPTTSPSRIKSTTCYGGPRLLERNTSL